MKQNELKEIKNMSVADLKAKIVKAKVEISDLILDRNMKKIKDVKSVGKKKKELAQVMTVLRQKQLLSELESKMENKETKEITSGKTQVKSKQSLRSKDLKQSLRSKDLKKTKVAKEKGEPVSP